ncbi:hypothetical protein MTO96_027058 [Rhipicephalus appendiculatus]
MVHVHDAMPACRFLWDARCHGTAVNGGFQILECVQAIGGMTHPSPVMPARQESTAIAGAPLRPKARKQTSAFAAIWSQFPNGVDLRPKNGPIQTATPSALFGVREDLPKRRRRPTQIDSDAAVPATIK